MKLKLLKQVAGGFRSASGRKDIIDDENPFFFGKRFGGNLHCCLAVFQLVRKRFGLAGKLSFLADEKKRDAELERMVISNPVSGKRKNPRLERFIKFILPENDLFIQNIIELIYEDRVAFIDLNKEEGLVIENASLADFQKVIFRQLYKKL